VTTSAEALIASPWHAESTAMLDQIRVREAIVRSRRCTVARG
jgi:hypothetical protein